jgi:tetratricopeptide (TPR) repeat protein
MYLGRYDEARRAAAAGRRRLERAGDRAALARLLNNEGNLWHRLDLPARALTCYRRAVRALERSGDVRSARMIGTNVGNCLSLLGRCDEARAHYRAARRAHEAADAASEALNATYNLAYLDFLEHRDEAALVGLAAVREEAVTRGLPALAALARLDRAEIFLRMGAHEEALDEGRAAIEACDALGLAYEGGKAELFAALAQFRLGSPAAARRGIDRALARFDAETNRVWTGEALLGLATLWWRDGNPRAAAALLSAARARFAAAGDREREACASTLESRALLACGQTAAARRRLAGGATRTPGSARLRHLRLAAGAALARHDGDIARARRLLARAAVASERLAARILDEQWRATFWGEWGWPHRERAALEMSQGRFAAALEALEAGRGRALVGPATHRRARGGELPASVRRWAASRHARERTRRAGESIAGAPPEAVGAALRRELSARPPRAIRAAALQRALPPDALLLDYLVHDGLVGALAVSRTAVHGRASLVPEPALARRVHALLFSLRGAAFLPPGERRADALLAEQLAEFASLALWPLLPDGAPRALAIAPAGPLTRLPWAALPLADGRVLCEACDVAIVPGLRLGLARRRAHTTTAAPLVVAVDAGDLDAVRSETDALLAAFPGATLLRGPEATAARFLALAPSAPWIHFAGHGGWRADAPHESGLRLHDRWLLASEIADLSLAARWVTLSACHTARALVHPGEEWFGLARSFLLAGSAAVVAAQWDVEDAATALLMSDLYRRLAAGSTLPRALADAQAARHLAGGHPLDWAGFVVLAGPGALAGGARGRPASGPGRNRRAGFRVDTTHAAAPARSGAEPANSAQIARDCPRPDPLDSAAFGGSRP